MVMPLEVPVPADSVVEVAALVAPAEPGVLAAVVAELQTPSGAPARF